MTGPPTTVRCPVVVGRADEQSEVDRLLGAAAAGRGGVLVLEGDAGVGKSRLTQEAVAAAGARGLRTGVGRASSSTLMPFRPLAEALLSATRAGGPPQDARLDPYRPALARIVPDWAVGGAAVEPSLVMVAEAMLRALAALAGDRGLLVVLEDLHWADAETLAVFEYLADNLAGAPVGVVATLRPRPGPAAAVARGLLSRGAAVHRPLGSLPADDVVDLAAACLGCRPAAVPPGLASLLGEAAGGLPLLVEDLLAALLAQGRLKERDGAWQLDPGAAPLPTRFADVVTARLADLDPGARAVLHTASVLGPRFDWEVLGPATGLPPEEVVAGLRRAVDAQLLTSDAGGFQFRHALTCDVVLATLDPPARARIQGRAAAALESSTGAGPDTAPLLAGLLIGAGEIGRGIRLLVGAARAAREGGALATAQIHLRAGLAAGTGQPEALEARVELLRVLVLAGDAGALDLARELPEELRRAGRADELRDVLLLATRAAVTVGLVDEARRHLAEARHGADPRQAAEIAVIEANLELATVGRDRLVAAEYLARRAVAAAESANAPDLVCEALEIVGRCGRVRSLPAAEEAFARALQVASDSHLPLWRIRALNELGTVDMFRDVDPSRLLLAREAALDAGALHLAAGVDVNLAAVLTMRAEHERALEFADECAALASRAQLPQLLAVAHLFQGVVATHQGRFGDMRACVGRAEALAGGDPDVLVGTWGMCRATASLLREDHERARRELETATERLAERPALAINPVEGPYLLLRATSGSTGRAEVEAYAGAQALGARWSGLWAELARGVVIGREGGDPGAATAAVEGAIAIGRPLPLFLALGLRLAGQAAVEGGWGDPAAWLGEAAGTFRRYGHVPAAAACRDLARRAGQALPRDRRVDGAVPAGLRARGVTAREHEVLVLVAERLTNRQIAGRLFLSPRTVEKHVASLLTKLDAGRRDDLVLVAQELAGR